MPTITKAQAYDWLHTVASRHVPSNARKYDRACYLAQKSVSGFGFQVDLKPAEGKVIEMTDDLVLLKTGRASFFVALKEALISVPDLGATVRITPYSRMRFDGCRLDKPVEKVEDGWVTQTFILGEYRSYLPIDKDAIQYPQFKDMIEVIESERADEVRTIAQVMIDAGALAEPVFFQDVADEEDVVAKPPTVRFRVATTKFTGYLAIVYDRPADTFIIVLYDNNLVETARFDNQLITIDEEHSTMGQKIIELVDDGLWKIAKVEVLKKASRARDDAAAAA